MAQLKAEAFGRAKAYVLERARPVDRALLAYFFSRGSADAVLTELAAFQNADGGLGHAMEPDVRVPDSSALATTVGMQYAALVDAPAEHPLVRGAIAYLLETYDPEAMSWAQLPRTAGDHPRANWWDYLPPLAFDPADPQWANPSCEVAAYLNRYATLVDPGFLAARTKHAAAWVETVDDPEPHALLCGMRFAESVTDDLRERLEQRVASLAKRKASLDPAEWPKYAAQPVWFARKPGTAIAEAFGDALEANIDFVIRSQQADGSWQPTWTWGRFEEAWPEAKQEWAGHLTVMNLKLLADFGRIEGRSE